MFSRKMGVPCLIKLAVLAVPAARTADTERWMETRIAGQPTGYIQEETQSVGSRIVTQSQSRTIMNRLGSKVEIVGKSRTEETTQGVVRISAEISSSLQKTLMEGRLEEQTLLLSISTGGKSYERKIALTEPLTGPEGARRLTLTRLREPGDRISYSSFSPELGTVNQITRSFKSRSASGIEVEESSSALPGSSMIWLDEQGRTQRRVQASPFGEIEIRVTTRERAMAAAGTGAELPAESYQLSVVRSNIRLPQERLIERLRVRITHKNPALGWPEFEDDRQTVISKSKDEVVLEVRQSTNPSHRPPAAEFSAPNALFQSDDRTIASIAREVAPLGKEIFALRDWTSRNMRFDPGIAVAPASEVVSNRAGTCFGYSVLLGSLARAAGIPSRMKMGFIYTGGIWGGHAWIEAFRDGEWVAVDAAMASPKEADAARISFFSSSLQEGTIAGLGDLARMYGNVNIEVLEYVVNGSVTVVPKGAESFRVEGDVYENPWLGLKLTKPSAFAFSRLDAAWPDTTIVALAGPTQERISIHHVSAEPDEYLTRNSIAGARRFVKHGGAPALRVTTREKAALVIRGEGNSWVVLAEGPSADRVLNKAVSGLSITRLRGNSDSRSRKGNN